VRKVFSDEGLLEIYKLYANVFRWSDYILNVKVFAELFSKSDWGVGAKP